MGVVGFDDLLGRSSIGGFERLKAVVAQIAHDYVSHHVLVIDDEDCRPTFHTGGNTGVVYGSGKSHCLNRSDSNEQSSLAVLTRELRMTGPDWTPGKRIAAPIFAFL